MSGNRKKQLVNSGAEALADALLSLASQYEAADDLVEQMIATPEENIQRFKEKLASLKRSRRFIHWGESAGFASELAGVLQGLRAGVDAPRTGTELTAAFYETDKGVLGNCDDSSGHVGDVYHFDARDLFVGYARHCPDKKWLANLVLKLNRKDDYGVRDTLIDCAAEYLPEPDIRTLISSIQKKADKAKDNKYEKRRWLHLVESLARQIGDAQCFEEARLASWDELSTAACMDIAQVYLESGNAETALSWLEKIPANDSFKANERDELLLDIFGQLGEQQKQTEVAWRIFRRHRNMESLQALLSVIGLDQREAVIAQEVSAILADPVLSLPDAAFLMELDCMEEAESYLLERVGQLNGDFYNSLPPLAKALETAERNIAATAVYRALLDSILRRGQTKIYPHGVRYLRKLDTLADAITDWRGLEDHDFYQQQLREKHGRKSSFWSHYEK